MAVAAATILNTPASTVTPQSTLGFDVVSATGGHVGGVAVSANRAYFAEGAGLTILDIGNALLPTQVGRLLLPAIAEDVQVNGSLAYITTNKGLYIADISHPATPAVLGSYATPGNALAVRVAGTRAYITVEGVYDRTLGDYVGKGLQIVDISAAAHPALLGSYATSDFPRDVQVVGNRAYLLHNSDSGVQILDVGDPAHIAPLGNYATPGKVLMAIKVLNGKGYIAYNNSSTSGGGLQIINVGTPSNPSLLGNYPIAGSVWDVQVSGNLAFLAAYSQFFTLDIGTPSSPSLVGTYHIPGIAEALYDGVQVVNGLAYLATESYTPDQITGVQIVDVHTPAAPSALGAYRTLFSIASSSSTGITLAGNSGYAFSGRQVRAFDITNPDRPTLIATSAPTTSYNLDIVGNLLYNAGDQNGLQIFDISNQNNPSLLGSYAEPNVSVDQVRVSQNRAYLSADGWLKVVDVSNPSHPALLGQHYIGVPYAYSIEVIGTLAYITTEYGLSIMDVSDPANIIGYAGYHPDTYTTAVEVVGQRAYLAAGGYTQSNGNIVGQGLYIADISDPAHPQQLGRYATPGGALAVRVVGDRAYVTGPSELWTIDIGDPANPTLLATYDLPSQPNGMVIRNDLMYVADGNAGLLVLRLQNSSPLPGNMGVNGGSLDFGGTLALTFPAGAVTAPVTVTYSLLSQPIHEFSGGWHAVRSFTLEARDGSGSLITHFAKPYTLTIGYTDEQLAALGVSEADLNLAFWDGSAWVNVLPCDGCGVDTANNRLTAVLDHFTEFALVGSVATGDGKSRVYLPLVVR